MFVYKKSVYQQVKQRLQTRGISHLNGDELSNYFSPWYSEHIGTVKVASGNRTLETWAATRLRKRYYIFTFPSLLKIHGDSELLRQLNQFLTNEAILEMNMKTVLPAFKEPLKRKWFEEVLDNFLRLWESNMWAIRKGGKSEKELCFCNVIQLWYSWRANKPSEHDLF